MKKARVALLIILLALAIVTLGGNVSAQVPSSSTAGASQEQSVPPQAERSAPTEPKIFTGKILKSGDKLVLTDAASKTIYQLDDQQKAQAFLGKKVKVTGVVDGNSDVIRVTAIDPV